jgi:hypothetical protein
MTIPQKEELADNTASLPHVVRKRVSYEDLSEDNLRMELDRYVVTDEVEHAFSVVLERLISDSNKHSHRSSLIRVLGAKGAGKSAFTKYLGLALNRYVKVDGCSFLELLKQRFQSERTRVAIDATAASVKTEVVFISLGDRLSENQTGDSIFDVLQSTVLQFCGYSEDLKVAELERMLEGDGKLDAFKERAKEELGGIEWIEVHNQPLVANQIAAQLAAEFCPNLFKNVADFSALMIEAGRGRRSQVEELISLIRHKSGNSNILFVLDDVDRFAGTDTRRALEFQHLCEILISLGNVSLMATAEPHEGKWDSAPAICLVLEKFHVLILLSDRRVKSSSIDQTRQQ